MQENTVYYANVTFSIPHTKKLIEKLKKHVRVFGALKLFTCVFDCIYDIYHIYIMFSYFRK